MPLLLTINIKCCLWLQWVLVTFVGFFVSLLLVEIGEQPDMKVFEAAACGACIGLAQSLVLRQRIKGACWWVLASFAIWGLMGGSGIGAVGWVVPRTDSIALRAFYGVVYGAPSGLAIGVAQWLVIRQQVSKAWWWILANIVCWSIGLANGWTVGAGLRLTTRLFLGEVVGLAVAWLVVGALTGVALIWLLWTESPAKLSE